MALLHVSLGRLIQDADLLFVLAHLLLHQYSLLLELIELGYGGSALYKRVPVFIAIYDVLYLLDLLEKEHHLRLPLSNLESVCGVLLVKLNESLLKLQDFLVSDMDFSHHILLLLLVLGTLIAVAARTRANCRRCEVHICAICDVNIFLDHG